MLTVEEARKVERPEIIIGATYTFYAEMMEEDKPTGERMRDYTGQSVVVMRQLTSEESDWFEPYQENGELVEPEVSRGWIVRADDGREFTALEEELNGWDFDLGQFYGPSGTWGDPS